jgi:hypothetical protein
MLHALCTKKRLALKESKRKRDARSALNCRASPVQPFPGDIEACAAYKSVKRTSRTSKLISKNFTKSNASNPRTSGLNAP